MGVTSRVARDCACHDDKRRTAEAVEDIGFGILRKRLCAFCGFRVDAVGVIAPYTCSHA